MEVVCKGRLRYELEHSHICILMVQGHKTKEVPRILVSPRLEAGVLRLQYETLCGD